MSCKCLSMYIHWSRLVSSCSRLFPKLAISKNGGQIYFENNTIKSIYNRHGKKLSTWPEGSPSALQVGDRVEDIYSKLISIEANKHFTPLFQYIGMFDKNINAPFDRMQEESSLWHFNFSIDSQQVMRLDLIFEGEILIKIRSRYERY